jgi:hypothetical protein
VIHTNLDAIGPTGRTSECDLRPPPHSRLIGVCARLIENCLPANWPAHVNQGGQIASARNSQSRLAKVRSAIAVHRQAGASTGLERSYQFKHAGSLAQWRRPIISSEMQMSSSCSGCSKTLIVHPPNSSREYVNSPSRPFGQVPPAISARNVRFRALGRPGCNRPT